jgi:hypothetical protein
LRRNGGGVSGVTVADASHSDPRHHIDEAVAVDIMQDGALAAIDGYSRELRDGLAARS